MLSDDIVCNVKEAEGKISTAYKLKSEHPYIAAWYSDMAVAHLGFNPKAHELITAEINSYANGDEYKKHPEYVDGMKLLWTDRHNEIIIDTAKVRSMIDTFKI